MRKFLFLGLALSIFVGFSASGCGYSATRLLPAEYKVLYIEPLKNRIPIANELSERTGLITNVPELEENVMQALINRFLIDGNLRLTSEPGRADLVLEGELRDFYRQPIRRLDNDEIEEYRLNLSAQLVLTDRKGVVILEEPNLVADTTYFVTGSQAVNESSAVTDLAEDFSRRVVEWVIEYW